MQTIADRGQQNGAEYRMQNRPGSYADSGTTGAGTMRNEEIDDSLLQLKQSLERIAASRDHESETPPKKRVLSQAEQKVIADILSEYLA